jgi:hypothetical protein
VGYCKKKKKLDSLFLSRGVYFGGFNSGKYPHQFVDDPPVCPVACYILFKAICFLSMKYQRL